MDVQRQDSPSLTSEGPLNVDGNSISGQERRRAVQRALADELQLARLQADVLVRLDEADQAGDNEAVLVCHAELDHVMTRMAEAEHVRAGAGAALTDENDLICAGCGAAAEPQYETPRLLGYRCSRCDWVGDDPTAEAAGAAQRPRMPPARRSSEPLSPSGKCSRSWTTAERKPVTRASARFAHCTMISPRSTAGFAGRSSRHAAEARKRITGWGTASAETCPQRARRDRTGR